MKRIRNGRRNGAVHRIQRQRIGFRPYIPGFHSNWSRGDSVRGGRTLTFKILSTSHVDVSRTSSVVNWLDKRESNIRRTLLIMRSQIPPRWLALGGVNFHLHPLSPKVRINLSRFQACRHFRTIDSAPPNFVPLSLNTIFG